MDRVDAMGQLVVTRDQVEAVVIAADVRIEQAGVAAVQAERERLRVDLRRKRLEVAVQAAGVLCLVTVVLAVAAGWGATAALAGGAAAAVVVASASAGGFGRALALLPGAWTSGEVAWLKGVRQDAEAAEYMRLQSAEVPDGPGAVLPGMLADLVAAQTDGDKLPAARVLPREGARWPRGSEIYEDGWLRVEIVGVDDRGRLVDVLVAWPPAVDADGLPADWPAPGPRVALRNRVPRW